MINQIKYSGLFPEPHISPVGTVQGLNQPTPQPAAHLLVPRVGTEPARLATGDSTVGQRLHRRKL